MYSSDVGKMIGCPVLHVNGDNPEVLYASSCKGFYLNLKGGGGSHRKISAPPLPSGVGGTRCHALYEDNWVRVPLFLYYSSFEMSQSRIFSPGCRPYSINKFTFTLLLAPEWVSSQGFCNLWGHVIGVTPNLQTRWPGDCPFPGLDPSTNLARLNTPGTRSHRQSSWGHQNTQVWIYHQDKVTSPEWSQSISIHSWFQSFL